MDTPVAIGTARFVAARDGHPRRAARIDRTSSLAATRGWVRLTAATRPGDRDRGARRCATSTTFACCQAITTLTMRDGRQVFGTHVHFRQTPQDKLAFVARGAGNRDAVC